MAGDILDLIDRSIDDWETSDDAMRWSPDVKPDPRPVVVRAAAVRVRADDLDPQQLAAIGEMWRQQVEAWAAMWRGIVDGIAASLRPLGEALRGFAASYVIFDEPYRWERERRDRVARMHRAYDRRRRARRRPGRRRRL